ncbi:MAG: hypothetical protein J5608_03610 [Alphaproteobacteria bacterium]|nr:hypothetical protein [Alphaproteobacteria bacterium]
MMARAELLAKREKKEARAAQDEQNQNYQQYTTLITKINYALQSTDDNAAIKILKNPTLLLKLITDKTSPYNLYYKYAMHALALTLAPQKSNVQQAVNQILTQIDRSDTNKLKKCIAVAQKLKIPTGDQESRQVAANRLKKEKNPDNDVAINNSIDSQVAIMQEVCDLWDDAEKTLKEMSENIQEFEREPVVQDVPVTDKPEENPEPKQRNEHVWGMEELAKKLGYTDFAKFQEEKKLILKLYPTAKDIFVKRGDVEVINVTNFERYLSLIQSLYIDTPNGKKLRTKVDWIVVDEEFATNLGYKNKTSFTHTKKYLFKTRPYTPAQDWFMSKHIPKTHTSVLLFDAAHLNDLQLLFGTKTKNKVRAKPQTQETKNDAVKTLTDLTGTVVVAKKQGFRKITKSERRSFMTELKQKIKAMEKRIAEMEENKKKTTDPDKIKTYNKIIENCKQVIATNQDAIKHNQEAIDQMPTRTRKKSGAQKTKDDAVQEVKKPKKTIKEKFDAGKKSVPTIKKSDFEELQTRHAAFVKQAEQQEQEIAATKEKMNAVLEQISKLQKEQDALTEQIKQQEQQAQATRDTIKELQELLDDKKRVDEKIAKWLGSSTDDNSDSNKKPNTNTDVIKAITDKPDEY